MKVAAILLPACFPDAIGKGEWHGDHVGCPECSTVQRVERFDLRWACANPACPLVSWLERGTQAN